MSGTLWRVRCSQEPLQGGQRHTGTGGSSARQAPLHPLGDWPPERILAQNLAPRTPLLSPQDRLVTWPLPGKGRRLVLTPKHKYRAHHYRCQGEQHTHTHTHAVPAPLRERASLLKAQGPRLLAAVILSWDPSDIWRRHAGGGSGRTQLHSSLAAWPQASR